MSTLTNIALSAMALVVMACSAKEAPPLENKPAPAAAKVGSYTCPMHPEVVAAAPGKCPKCGMDLVSTAPQAPLAVSVSMSPATPKAGEPTRLVFRVTSAGQSVTSFEVVHEKKLHLLIVTADLARFAHEHPELQPDGSFVLDTTFPVAGHYRLFSDFKATDRAGAVLTTDVVVDGPVPAAQALVASELKAARTVDGFEVRFTSTPPTAGVSKALSFLVTKGGKPVTDLEPYLGAMGHLVIIGSDVTTFLHAHPEDHAPPGHVDAAGSAPHAHGAPGVVSFATTFPRPGLYKAWAQFQVKGKPVVADFVFDVPAGPPGEAPASGAPHDAAHGAAHGDQGAHQH